MVSKASEDLPDPLTPVMTTNLLRGTTTSMFLRLCSRAPRMTMDSMCWDANSAVAEGVPASRAAVPAAGGAASRRPCSLHRVEQPISVGAARLSRKHDEFRHL